jgi:predicted nucleotidyltransferase
MTLTQLKEKYKKEAKRLVEKLKKEYQPLKIYLFGSIVWGKFTFDSDLDFLIIKESKKNKLERMKEVGKILLERKAPLDILVYTPKEIEERKKLGDPFIKEILNKGKLLYEKK